MNYYPPTRFPMTMPDTENRAPEDGSGGKGGWKPLDGGDKASLLRSTSAAGNSLARAGGAAPPRERDTWRSPPQLVPQRITTTTTKRFERSASFSLPAQVDVLADPEPPGAQRSPRRTHSGPVPRTPTSLAPGSWTGTIVLPSTGAARWGAEERALGATGKRPAGVGTEDEGQEIVSAERTKTGVVLRITLLAAGFVVGPNGASVHQIESVTKTQLYSFNRSQDKQVRRPTRQFHIEGAAECIQHAVDIICHAVQLYKDLAEGDHCGRTVRRLHKLDKVLFRYEPPPRSKVPYAAQVEYDPAELKVLQALKGPKSAHAIRQIREQLARRDEALMRQNLPSPPNGKSRAVQYRRAGKFSAGQPFELGEPNIQNHDKKDKEGCELSDYFDALAVTHSAPKPSAPRPIMRERNVKSPPQLPPGFSASDLAGGGAWGRHQGAREGQASMFSQSFSPLPSPVAAVPAMTPAPPQVHRVFAFNEQVTEYDTLWNPGFLYGLDLESLIGPPDQVGPSIWSTPAGADT